MSPSSMATPREPSVAPSSPSSTISDPDKGDQKPLLLDLDNDETVDSPLPTEITPRKSAASRRSGGDSSRVKKPKQSRKSKGTPKKAGHLWIQEGPQDGTEDEGSVASFQKSNWNQRKSRSPHGSDTEMKRTQGTAIGTRRQANGTIGSVYSGSKIRHIKKEDGTPLWRKDIQYTFLDIVVQDTNPVFTRISDGQKGCNFADIYIDALARSSKTSKILKDRLQTDRPAAQNMAMICLLVNVGRMNTTLNFFPEMRAQLRTYHSIPSLQSYNSQRDYKSLQDAPRLKSILKGASEDDPSEPRTLDDLMKREVPRTNPVNLIFTLSHYAPKISDLHFNPSVDFFDLVIRPTLSSKSRARAFLWLMWWYLESDFSKEAAASNPFGPGQYGQNIERDENLVPIKVSLDHISEEEGDRENEDTADEKVFAVKMQQERKRILLEEIDPDNKLLKRVRKSGVFDNDESILSDADSTAKLSIGGRQSPSLLTADRQHSYAHPSTSVLGGQADSLEDDWEAVDPHPGRGRYKRPKNKTREGHVTSSSGRVLLKSARAQAQDRGTPDTATPQPLPPGSAHPVLNQFGAHQSRSNFDNVVRSGQEGNGPAGSLHRKPRPMTQHQRALESHRRDRVEYVLATKKRKLFEEKRGQREQGSWLLKEAMRIASLPTGYDSEEEGESWGLGGLLGKIKGAGKRNDSDDTEDESEEGIFASKGETGGEDDDYGEEAESWARVMRRTRRRLDKWSGDKDVREYEARTAAILEEQINSRGEMGAGGDVTMNGGGNSVGQDGTTDYDIPLGESSPVLGAGTLRRLDPTRGMIGERVYEDEEMAEDDDDELGNGSEEDLGEDSDMEVD